MGLKIGQRGNSSSSSLVRIEQRGDSSSSTLVKSTLVEIEQKGDSSSSTLVRIHCEKNNWKTVETGEQLVNLELCSYLYP